MPDVGGMRHRAELAREIIIILVEPEARGVDLDVAAVLDMLIAEKWKQQFGVILKC